MPPFLLIPHPPIRIKFFFLFPQTVTGGDNSTGFIELNDPAPPGGAVINLKSLAPLYASVPTTVTVPAGVSCATFPIVTSATALLIHTFIVARHGKQKAKARPFTILAVGKVPSVQVVPPSGDSVYVAAMWNPTPPGTSFVFTYTVTGPGVDMSTGASSSTPATFNLAAGAGSGNTSQPGAPINTKSFAKGTYTVTGSCLANGVTTNLVQATFNAPG